MNEDDRQLGREKTAGVKQGLGTRRRYIFFLLCLFYYTNEYLKPAVPMNGDDGSSRRGWRWLGISDGGCRHLGWLSILSTAILLWYWAIVYLI